MKKFLIGGVLVVLLGGYALWSASRSQTPASVTEPAQNLSSGSETTGIYKDGTYTGSVGDAAPYGQVQVSATISGGKLTAITLLKAPSGPGQTNEVTARAFPILIQEAIAAQSAKVHIVSGATQDSQGFQQSLNAALTEAQA